MVEKDLLFKAHVTEAAIELPQGIIVRVRGLTRGEVTMLNQGDHRTLEARSLARAMVDPELTEAEVARWYDAWPAGAIQPVIDKVMELSGLTEGAEKEAMLTFRDPAGD